MSPDVWSWWCSPAALAVLGLCVGSFLNVVIYRLPVMLERDWRCQCAELLKQEIEDAGPPLSLSKPRSRCPKCGHVLRWYENIPVLGWLGLKGRCSGCKTRIPARYPLVEALTGVLFAAVAWKVGPQPQALLWCGAVAAFIALAFIDWDTTFLPDDITQPLLWAGIIAAAMGWTLPLLDSLWGAVAGYLSLWSVNQLYKRVRKEDGMMDGDFKLLAGIGAWLGWTMLLPVLIAACVAGIIGWAGLKLTGALHEGRYVPFGPFLSAAAIAAFLIGPETVKDWLGWY
ncbi:prepilin peptidase [Eleftheria terrae]|uniref:prepilin peptidase n=1 Tax=Eleftheria terrae TaxID=1597781 RepID=UPI00263B9379|nr:A24 family peptidase [Eleftheria terrae]WKB54737.1 A24 family peptidase [Eleftheria terrae]